MFVLIAGERSYNFASVYEHFRLVKQPQQFQVQHI